MTHIDYTMSNADYHDKEKHPHISSSDVKAVHKKSLLHWALEQNMPRTESKAMLMGSAVHGMILEPEKKEFVRGLPNRLKRKEWAELEEKCAKNGQTLLTESEYDEAERITETAKQTCETLRYVLDHKRFVPEASIFTQCRDTKLPIKCRPDAMILPDEHGKGGMLFDVKTTTDATPEAFQHEIKKWAYDLQAAFYIHTCQQAKININSFIFFAVEKPTGICVAYELSELYLSYGRRNMFRAMHEIAEAKETGNFTTGWDSINTIHMPSYLEDKYLAESETPF